VFLRKNKGGCVSCLEGREAGAKHRAEGEPGRERPRRGNALVHKLFRLFWLSTDVYINANKRGDFGGA
jgi:hypothetical protein